MKKKTLLLAKYLKLYEKNETSKVFAPLAECYRQLGMLEEAKLILQRGLETHPNYPLALLVLSRCYVDEEKYLHAYNLLKDQIPKHRENLAMLKHFADICYHLNYHKQALENYKTLLFHQPTDHDLQQKIEQIESELGWGSYYKETPIESSFSEDPDDWSCYDFFSNTPQIANDDIGSSWEVNPEEISPYSSRLVGLYKDQGLYAKALEMLDNLKKDEYQNYSLEKKELESLLAQDEELFEEYSKEEIAQEISAYKKEIEEENSEINIEGLGNLETLLQSIQERINLRAAQIKMKRG